MKSCLPHVVVSLNQRKKDDLTVSLSAKEPSRIITTNLNGINRSISSKIFPLKHQPNTSTLTLERKKYLQNTDLKSVNSQKDLHTKIEEFSSDYFATNEVCEKSPHVVGLDSSIMDQHINLRNNYQKHIPQHKGMHQRPHTQMQKRSVNNTF